MFCISFVQYPFMFTTVQKLFKTIDQETRELKSKMKWHHFFLDMVYIERIYKDYYTIFNMCIYRISNKKHKGRSNARLLKGLKVF